LAMRRLARRDPIEPHVFEAAGWQRSDAPVGPPVRIEPRGMGIQASTIGGEADGETNMASFREAMSGWTIAGARYERSTTGQMRRWRSPWNPPNSRSICRGVGNGPDRGRNGAVRAVSGRFRGVPGVPIGGVGGSFSRIARRPDGHVQLRPWHSSAPLSACASPRRARGARPHVSASALSRLGSFDHLINDGAATSTGQFRCPPPREGRDAH
jgi:hypothetical protein